MTITYCEYNLPTVAKVWTKTIVWNSPRCNRVPCVLQIQRIHSDHCQTVRLHHSLEPEIWHPSHITHDSGTGKRKSLPNWQITTHLGTINWKLPQNCHITPHLGTGNLKSLPNCRITSHLGAVNWKLLQTVILHHTLEQEIGNTYFTVILHHSLENEIFILCQTFKVHHIIKPLQIGQITPQSETGNRKVL